MDPDETLKNIVEAATRILAGVESGNGYDEESPVELAGDIIILHGWILTGGMLPAQWRVQK